MSEWRKWALDRVIVTAIGVVVIGGGGSLALNTSWFKAPRRGTPIGEMTPEEIRRQPAVQTRQITVGVLPPEGWLLVTASYEVETRETVAISEIEIRTGGGRIVVREAATTFADGDRTLISFPVITQAQQMEISGRFAMEEAEDATVRCRVRYVKLGRNPTLLRREDGRWVSATGVAEDARRRDPKSGLYAHALPAADFRERLAARPFESPYEVAVNAKPPPSLLAARNRAGVFDGRHIWLRGTDAWLLESSDGRTRLVGKGPVEDLPGRFVEIATALRAKETSRRHPPYAGEVRVGGVRIDVGNLLPTVRRLDGEGRAFDGLQIRDR